MGRNKSGQHSHNQGANLCENMSFTSAEEYKMLRTKIDLVLPRELRKDGAQQVKHTCRMLGITSALRGEGKSTTAINLAYSFAEAGYKVCLLEADMRLPSISGRLKLRETPGLSNILTGKIAVKEAVQQYATRSGTSFEVIAAGDLPPLPSELLSSGNMELLLKSLAGVFDYILIDLPPVNVVTDALALSKLQLLDGMLFVAREKIGTKNALRHALEQFEMTRTKILGIVYNGAKTPAGTSHYYRKG